MVPRTGQARLRWNRQGENINMLKGKDQARQEQDEEKSRKNPRTTEITGPEAD